MPGYSTVKNIKIAFLIKIFYYYLFLTSSVTSQEHITRQSKWFALIRLNGAVKMVTREFYPAIHLSSSKISLFLFILNIAVLFIFATPDYSWSESEIEAFTVPSADVTLSFIHAGRIAEVYVKQGDMVKAEQILIQQDDNAEQAQLSIIKAQSEDTSQIEAAEASLDQKKVYLKKLKWAFERVSATELEIEKAQLEVKIAELQLKIAKFEHNQNGRKYNEAKIRVNNMSLKSPIAGKVEKVEVEVGESIDGLADAVRIIRTDPLWIDVPVPLEFSKSLRLNQSVQLTFMDDSQEIVEGRIIFISSYADSASTTIIVRIEVPNSSGRPAGEHTIVSFSQNQ